MAFAYQKDSYLKQLTSEVKSCTPAQRKVTQNGKPEVVDGFDVILEDTILFPEGGGQPDDRGTINNIEVLQITRKGATPINFIQEELSPGTTVDLHLDWSRRFDHMQQHSGQHLISALLESMYGFPTPSWYLGVKVSFVELDTPKMSQDQIAELENVSNEKIREAIPVTVSVYSKNDPEFQKIETRGLPGDHEGDIRMINIEGGIDSNPCCGTHVSNLSHLQAIKLLYAEKGKKGKTNLYFVVGNRVLSYLGRCCEVEKTLTGILKGPLDDQVQLAERAVKGMKMAQKGMNTLLKDIAVLEAYKFNSQPSEDSVFIHYRKDGDPDYMNILVEEIKDKNITCFVTVGDDKGAGNFLLYGQEELVQEVGPKICDIMEGKGAGHLRKYRGKVNKVGNRNKAEKLLRQYLSQKTES
ncbi:alanyl-tRNA editing protein Aarsd1-like [Gigantopelta aegis]|uniref:alanyl-tRNA editing protein Aarsd1-like n=1 Tax=Gigantopelta aegis TaxID=1735272 RepID=UPI001B887607|nr:alanyl-tRNA editing protein Aarsd1-like [Gigantopelta aegis]